MTRPAMKWGAAISGKLDATAAAEDCAAKLETALDGARPDVVFIFASGHYREHYERIASSLRSKLNPARLLGCSGGGIIGDNQEVEDAPALAVSAAVLPGATLHPFYISDKDLPDLDGGPRPWEEAVGVKASADPSFIVLANPFTIRAEDLLNGLDFAFPKAKKVGGLASAASGPGQNALFLDETMYRSGAIGLACTGNVRLDVLVAQGCRPIGKPMTVTKCRRNFLLGLSDRRPVQVIQELYRAAADEEQELIRSALFLGVVLDPFRNKAPQPGDFLIRNILGQTPEEGGLAVTALLREGQVVQFHVRDSAAAHEDLNAVLRRYSTDILKEGKGESMPPPPAGALLFSCLGRGRHMYGHPNHDSENFQTLLGPVPLTGFFCNGEIGPVGETTYIHGFTSCFGLFRPKHPAVPVGEPPND